MAGAGKYGDTVPPTENGNGVPPSEENIIELPHALSVRQLSELLNASAIDVIKQLMRDGIMANINQVVDYEAASAVASSLGYKAQPQPQTARDASSVISEMKKQQLLVDEGNLKSRPPIITIMGHVDHGKTRLLDAIRQANVMDSEAGGITQHIGAYQVEINNQKITFLDTPGHEAFTAMRARGARITDITVLVVAADDGVKPQTLEAINHAKAAKVPIVVAINKIDKASANPDRVKQQLADAGLVTEEWGGDVICVPVSAKNREGIDTLLENLLLVAEIENLRADPSKPAKGVVVEAEMDKSKGPLATVLVHDGTLKTGDMVVVGSTWGRVKAMFNNTGKQIKKARPSTPVVILGLHSVPQVGDTLSVVPSEKHARALVDEQLQKEETASRAVNLTNILDQIDAGHIKDLNIVLKVDVQGSIEPIKNSLEKLSTDKVQVNLIHSSSGNTSESDVMLAIASKGVIVAFNTGVETGAQRLADTEDINIRHYSIIYNMIDDVEKALKGMLEPEYIEVIDGRAEVRTVFSSSKKKSIAGSYVTEGQLTRGASARVIRGGKIVAESSVDGLRRFKDDVREVPAGYECGVSLSSYNDFKEGDILEFYSRRKSS